MENIFKKYKKETESEKVVFRKVRDLKEDDPIPLNAINDDDLLNFIKDKNLYTEEKENYLRDWAFGNLCYNCFLQFSFKPLEYHQDKWVLGNKCKECNGILTAMVFNK